MLTAHAGQLYEIPWREEPASWRHEATLRLRDDGLARRTFGEGVSFDRKGTVHRGHVHRCGLARKVTAVE